MSEYSEKRDFQRMTLESSLEYQLDSDVKTCEGTVKNLSAKGLMFTACDDIPVGQSLVVKLTPVNTITPPMSADVKVIRCDQLNDKEYSVACEIVQIK